ncbi:hypothetical protein HYW19_00105 [Candidatus Woesearchaeota archaeon]|nr:hypothetical protein [Candidatus Woesearchaeota archaeon]
MYETIKEGSAIIRIKKAEKISKEMEVFYNPLMKLNRDITILLLQQFPSMHLCDPLAASGVRSIRFAKELKYKSITINDINKKAVNSIKNNLKFNKLNNNKRIKVYNDDTNLFLLNSRGFDYIDVDPFGSSNYYLDAAIKRISRNGILAVTNTDTAALTGTYPNACVRKYWAAPKLDYLMHETGLRILIRKIQLVGMQYEKALFPIFSYSKDHYFRIFFICLKGKKICDEIAEKHGMLNNSGPLWLGSLWDKNLVNGMYAALLKNAINNSNNKNSNSTVKYPIKNIMPNNKNINNKIIINNNKNELLKFLKTIKDESKINSIGFYDLHYLAEKKRLGTMGKKEGIIKNIKSNGYGYMASGTHFSGTGIKSNIPYAKLLPLLKE